MKDLVMWQIVVGFLAFAGLAIFVLSKGGDIDLTGEKRGALPLTSFSGSSANL